MSLGEISSSKKTKKLFAYFATADEVGLKRLRNSIALQKAFDVFDENSVKVLTIGSLGYQPTEDIREYFDNIILIDTYHIDNDGIQRLNYCRLRNPSLDYAMKINAKWLYFCDIDTVYIKVAEPEEQNTINIARVYWQKDANETIEWSVDHIANWGEAVFSAGNSWFIIHHSIFGRFRFNEHLWGYTFDDTEYSVRVCSAMGGPHRVENAHVVHIFHENSLRNLEYVSYNRNQSIYNAVLNMTQWDCDLAAKSYYYDSQANEAIVIESNEQSAFSSACVGAGRVNAVDNLLLVRWNDRGAIYEVTGEKPFEQTCIRIACFSLSSASSTIDVGDGSEEKGLQIDLRNNMLFHGSKIDPSNFVIDGSVLKVCRKDKSIEQYRITRLDLEKV